MEESQDSGDLEDHQVPLDSIETEALEAVPEPDDPPPAREDLDAENRDWDAMTVAKKRAGLREVIKGTRPAPPEALVRLCCRAHEEGDRATLNLAFEALAKRASRLLMSQAPGVSIDERRDHAQEVLLKIFNAILDGKAAFATQRFAAFCRRRSIELYRAHKSTWEGANRRIEPTEDDDPLDRVPSRATGPEFRALVSLALAKLPRQQAEAFIQYHHLGLTHAEIATQHGVTGRTIQTWIGNVKQALDISGEEL